jgi:hypothetical protein
MADLRDWHRMFAVSWCDFLTGQPVNVDSEIDLSRKQQWLDVVLLRKEPEPLTVQMPDGFEELAPYNLISFKSFQETLDGWTLNELVGHYVNYRKQVSPNMNELLPESEFRLFAVTTRYPQNLARLPLRRAREGVYDLAHFTGDLRIIVIHQLPQEGQNALLHLFSALKPQFAFGRANYQLRSSETTSFLYQLFGLYLKEGMNVPIDMQEFVREAQQQMLNDMSPEQRRAFLQKLTPQERLAGLSPEEILKALQALSPEAKETLRRQLEAEKGSPEQK